jgi:hypothetical protein
MVLMGHSEAVAARAVVELVGGCPGGANVRQQRRRCGLGGRWFSQGFFRGKSVFLQTGEKGVHRRGPSMGFTQFVAAALPKAPICALKL